MPVSSWAFGCDGAQTCKSSDHKVSETSNSCKWTINNGMIHSHGPLANFEADAPLISFHIQCLSLYCAHEICQVISLVSLISVDPLIRSPASWLCECVLKSAASGRSRVRTACEHGAEHAAHGAATSVPATCVRKPPKAAKKEHGKQLHRLLEKPPCFIEKAQKEEYCTGTSICHRRSFHPKLDVGGRGLARRPHVQISG